LLSEDERRHLCELDRETSAALLPPGCYLNHACDPNAMRHGVDVYAWQEIHAGDEFTIDLTPSTTTTAGSVPAGARNVVLLDFLCATDG
jgi:hypothetical protein